MLKQKSLTNVALQVSQAVDIISFPLLRNTQFPNKVIESHGPSCDKMEETHLKEEKVIALCIERCLTTINADSALRPNVFFVEKNKIESP